MDTRIKVNRLSRELFRRGMHRTLGNPFLGTFTAFLTVLFLIRITVNLYLAIDLANKGSNVDAVQVAGAHLVILSAYVLWVGSLATFRLSFALPRACFIDFAPLGRRFRLDFMRRVASLRPMNIAFVAIMLFTSLVFSAADRALLVLGLTLAGSVLVITVASWAISSRSEIQALEMLYLLFLVYVNPDIGPFNNRVSILFYGIHRPFHSVWELASAIGLIAAIAILLLLIVKTLAKTSNLFRRRLSLSPMVRWYWRFIRIRSWVLLYIFMAPFFISSAISPGAKRWALVLSILFCTANYLSFIAQCENTLGEKWRCSLFDKGNTRLITGSLLTHAVLAAVPVLGYILAQR